MRKEEILSNPIFIREKSDHDLYCDDGEITVINKFTLEVNYKACRFCQRIEQYKQKQQARVEQDHGNQNITRDG